MEALVVRRLGDPTLPPGGEDSPFTAVFGAQPVPDLSSPTSVRVRVAATSLNFATFLQVQGKYQERPTLPFVPGYDYAGVVDAVGSAVRRFRPGERICSLASVGSFAERDYSRCLIDVICLLLEHYLLHLAHHIWPLFIELN